MQMVFKFAQSAHLGGNPQEVGETLHKIKRTHGNLSPRLVIEAARPAGSALHRYFDWDNKKAAEKWRIVQARDLIASVVTVEVKNRKVLPVRSFISVGKSYEPVFAVLSDERLRQMALQDLQNSIAQLEEKIRTFRDLRDVLQALRRVREVARKHVRQAGRGTRRLGKASLGVARPGRHGVALHG